MLGGQAQPVSKKDDHQVHHHEGHHQVHHEDEDIVEMELFKKVEENNVILDQQIMEYEIVFVPILVKSSLVTLQGNHVLQQFQMEVI